MRVVDTFGLGLRFLNCEIDHDNYTITFWQIHKMTTIFTQKRSWVKKGSILIISVWLWNFKDGGS